MIGYPPAIVQQQFTLAANPTTGTGPGFGNSQIIVWKRSFDRMNCCAA